MSIALIVIIALVVIIGLAVVVSSTSWMTGAGVLELLACMHSAYPDNLGTDPVKG